MAALGSAGFEEVSPGEESAAAAQLPGGFPGTVFSHPPRPTCASLDPAESPGCVTCRTLLGGQGLGALPAAGLLVLWASQASRVLMPGRMEGGEGVGSARGNPGPKVPLTSWHSHLLMGGFG